MAELTFNEHLERIVKKEVYCNASHLITRLMGDQNYCDELCGLYDGEDEEGNYREPLQYYIVSDWLFDKLKGMGELVEDFAEMKIWGRCTYGQMIESDTVIEDIVHDLMKQ